MIYSVLHILCVYSGFSLQHKSYTMYYIRSFSFTLIRVTLGAEPVQGKLGLSQEYTPGEDIILELLLNNAPSGSMGVTWFTLYTVYSVR